MSNIHLNLEDSVCMMDRADDLIALALEFLDDLPDPDNREEQWKLIAFNRRSEMLRSLIYSVGTTIDQAKGIVKQKVCGNEASGEVYS